MSAGPDVLGREVYVDDSYKQFGQLTEADALKLAESMTGHSGGGLERHTAPVAAAWRELGAVLSGRGIETVAGLEDDEVRRFAERVRVIPPGGSWLQ